MGGSLEWKVWVTFFSKFYNEKNPTGDYIFGDKQIGLPSSWSASPVIEGGEHVGQFPGFLPFLLVQAVSKGI